MKKTIFFFLLGMILIIGTFGQVTNGQFIQNVAALVSRANDWTDRFKSFIDSQFDNDNHYIGTDSYETYVFRQGAFSGASMAFSLAIDDCVSLNLQSTDPESYRWLNRSNADIAYRNGQRPSWYKSLSAELKKAWDAGYLRGCSFEPGRNARFPNVWEWEYH